MGFFCGPGSGEADSAWHMDGDLKQDYICGESAFIVPGFCNPDGSPLETGCCCEAGTERFCSCCICEGCDAYNAGFTCSLITCYFCYKALTGYCGTCADGCCLAGASGKMPCCGDPKSSRFRLCYNRNPDHIRHTYGRGLALVQGDKTIGPTFRFSA